MMSKVLDNKDKLSIGTNWQIKMNWQIDELNVWQTNKETKRRFDRKIERKSALYHKNKSLILEDDTSWYLYYMVTQKKVGMYGADFVIWSV